MSEHDSKNAMTDKMRALARSYVPEWHFSTQDPDVGSVAAMLVGDMLEDNARRIDSVLRKHRIQYLNLFDPYKEEPIESARTYEQFYVVPGIPEPAYVPKGTKILAEQTGQDQQIVFETAFGITPVDTRLSAVYAADGKKDRIVRQAVSDDEINEKGYRFTAFDTTGENLAWHAFHIGFHHVLDHLDTLDLHLAFRPVQEDGVEQLIESLLAPGMRFALVTGTDGNGGYQYRTFDLVERQGNAIHLAMEDIAPTKVPVMGEACYVIALLSEMPSELEIAGVRLWLSASDLPARDVVSKGIPQNPQHFHLFGLPMEIYAICEMESEVLDRRGAQVQMSFQLSYETVEQLLPEYEMDTEYRVIMKKPPSRSKPKTNQVRCDYVLMEYLGQGGWKRIVNNEDVSVMFSGSKEGTVSIPFTVPGDILDAAASGGPRFRLRLLRADNLYKLPCRQICPVIDNLRFSYSYEREPCGADVAVIYNNFVQTNVQPQLAKERLVRPFVSAEYPGNAQYFGFSQSPHGTPLSIFFKIGNTADMPLDFTAEYYTPGGFEPLKVVDMTAGMVYSEAMLFIVPKDIASTTLFGHDLYWIRLINHSKERLADNLPKVEGIYLNMARVENVNTRTEHFYLDNPDAQTRITLAEKGLISAKVYVNEAGGGVDRGENWVLWQKSMHREHQGRVYSIDLTVGEILFEKSVFSTFPVQEGVPSIRVVYQSYVGSAANIPAGSLTTLANSIRHVSRVTNPFPAYGGYDGYNEETSATIISNMLRTRGRAVSRQDYFDLISQVSYSVRRIRVLTGMDKEGRRQPETISIALLIDEYEQGGHIFSAVKNTVEQKLLASTNIRAMGKTLMLCQPKFVRISVRLWMECGQMEHAYDLQNECGDSIRGFLDPLSGGFDGQGWEIGALPTRSQLLAYLKIHHQDAVVSQMVMTARVDGKEFEVGDALDCQVENPFAMAVNGEHIVYVDLAQ